MSPTPPNKDRTVADWTNKIRTLNYHVFSKMLIFEQTKLEHIIITSSQKSQYSFKIICHHRRQPDHSDWMFEKSMQKKRYHQFNINFLSPFLTGRMFVRPNILRTLWRTMIHFLIELLVRRIWFGQSKLYFILIWLVMRCKLRPALAADAQQTAWSKM